MKKYDFKKAKMIIAANAKNLKTVSMGMYEDWFWTAKTIWEKGKYIKKLNNDTYLGGIQNSYWATPAIKLTFKNNKIKMLECSKGESDKNRPPFSLLGPLSKPVQDNLPPLIKDNEKI